MRHIRFLAAALICGVALALPYRVRVMYGRCLAAAAHLPFLLFGRLARYLLRQTGGADLLGRS